MKYINPTVFCKYANNKKFLDLIFKFRFPEVKVISKGWVKYWFTFAVCNKDVVWELLLMTFWNSEKLLNLKVHVL